MLDHAVSVHFISDISHFAGVLCADPRRIRFGYHFHCVDTRLSSRGFIRVCPKNSERRKTEHSVYAGAFVFAGAIVCGFLSDARGYGDDVDPVCLV